jgi:nucleolar protein 4
MSQGVKRLRVSADGDFDAGELTEREAKRPKSSTSDTAKDQRRTLFVRSLHASVTTERLTEFFSQTYPLKHATVVLDPQTHISKGYGFVTFADAEDAQAATAELNNASLDGRKIKVEIAEPRHREIAEDGGRSRPSSKAAELKAEREKKRKELLPPKLIVRNLPWSIKKSEDLAALFQSYGKVKYADVPQRSPKVQAGFGFVVLRGRKNAEKAMAEVNGKVVDGRPLAVDWAVDKETWEKLQNEEHLAGDGEPAQLSSGAEAKDTEKEHCSDSEAALGVVGDEDMDSSGDEANIVNGVRIEDQDMAAVDSEIDELEGTGPEDEDAKEAPSTTVFIRNLPFTSTDETLKAHFSYFGAVRYARIVFDQETERPRGTAFVCFFNEEDAKSCVKNAPKSQPLAPATTDKKRKGEALTRSVLQNEATDPTGQYTLEGRVLQVSKALSKSDATRREAEGSSKRELRDNDKRRLYLLSEGTIPRGSKLYEKLGATEINIREASTKQRQKLMKSNPSLHMSLTRLSIRNIPRSVTSKDLKALAREAVVGFATDVKNGLRQPLSKEELKRAADSMKAADRLRKQQGRGIVKQAKIVFEGREGAKVEEKSGAGRSRGYGFIEYVSHRAALMGLRWLNGHAVQSGDAEKSKRLIAEFAIENAQVVTRRADRETRMRVQGPRSSRERQPRSQTVRSQDDKVAGGKKGKKMMGKKGVVERQKSEMPKPPPRVVVDGEEKNNLAKRNRIIAKKRSMREARTAG